MPGPMENRIAAARPQAEDYTVHLVWRNGAETVADFKHLVGRGAFRAFEDRGFFAQVDVGEDGYSLVWPGGLDVSADSLWFKAHSEDNPFRGGASAPGRAAE